MSSFFSASNAVRKDGLFVVRSSFLSALIAERKDGLFVVRSSILLVLNTARKESVSLFFLTASAVNRQQRFEQKQPVVNLAFFVIPQLVTEKRIKQFFSLFVHLLIEDVTSFLTSTLFSLHSFLTVYRDIAQNDDKNAK